MVLDDLRQCQRKEHIFNYDICNNGIDNDDNNDNDSDSDSNNYRINNDVNDESDLPTSKKLRSTEAVAPTFVSPATTTEADPRGNETRELTDPSPPQQWWLSRHSLPIASHPSAPTRGSHRNDVSGIVLSEHLGRASDVVESLTHDVQNWSLTRLSIASTPATSSAAIVSGTASCADSIRKNKQKRCKDAQRQVRMARRRCLEEQKRQTVSSTNQ